MASNDLESVEELLAYRANPDIASDGEESPLCSAVRHRRRAIVGALLQQRADCNIRSQHLTPALADEQASRALHRWNWLDERLVDLLTEYCCTQNDVMTSALDG